MPGPLLLVAEVVGFEPTKPLGLTVFKTAAFNRSAKPPYVRYRIPHSSIMQHMVKQENMSRIDEAADVAYMTLALEEARAAAAVGEVPIGAVVVYEPIDRGTRRPTAEPRVIARAHNLRETTRDPAGHAEFLAMKEAARVLDAWRLADCTVYVTLEPCIMCAGLMHQARISRCVYGAPDGKAGALGTLYSIHADERLNHQFTVTSGVLEQACVDELRAFFATKRKARKGERDQACDGSRLSCRWE